MRYGAACFGLAWLLFSQAPAFAADSEGREIPGPFVPFEHMIGSWKGTAVPTANRVKGWPETHAWAWKFEKGQPVGMSVEFKGDKTLAKGLLSYDAAAKQYRLEGTDPAGKPVAYAGGFDKASHALQLQREKVPAGAGKERLVIRPNSNLIRYTMELDQQEVGAPQYKKIIQIGLGKEGESFAAGGSAADLPKCILTGGAATMTVTYQGKSYPICCSGCRDEFNENPEKYAKKAALMAEQGGSKTPAKRASSRVGKDDGSFDGLVDEATPKPSTTPKRVARPVTGPASKDSPDEKESASAKSTAAMKAAAQLRLGQNLEKAGKTSAALNYYRQVLKDYPKTPQAKTAAARIKALGGSAR